MMITFEIEMKDIYHNGYSISVISTKAANQLVKIISEFKKGGASAEMDFDGESINIEDISSINIEWSDENK